MQFFNQEAVFEMLVRAIVLLTAIPIHECAHALVADKLGDPTARNLGRITLNPLPHLDPVGSLLMLLTGFGWARPVPISTRNFKHIKRDMALSALAGPISNLLLALVVMVVLKGFLLIIAGTSLLASISETALMAILQILTLMMSINMGLAVFNMLPIPPLDGSRLLTALLPSRLYYGIMRYERYIMFGLLILMFTGMVSLPLEFFRSGLLHGMDWLTGFMGRLW